VHLHLHLQLFLQASSPFFTFLRSNIAFSPSLPHIISLVEVSLALHDLSRPCWFLTSLPPVGGFSPQRVATYTRRKCIPLTQNQCFSWQIVLAPAPRGDFSALITWLGEDEVRPQKTSVFLLSRGIEYKDWEESSLADSIIIPRPFSSPSRVLSYQ
jgi:hypothetical protein